MLNAEVEVANREKEAIERGNNKTKVCTARAKKVNLDLTLFSASLDFI